VSVCDRHIVFAAAVIAAMLAPAPRAGAETGMLPQLYRVAGVAADDVLNVRANPNAGAEIVATLPPDRRNLEVVELSEDGEWVLVGLGERGGWASRAYLEAEPVRPTDRVPAPMRCFGTEPFWSLYFPGDGTAGYDRMPEPERRFAIAGEIVPAGTLGELAVTLDGTEGDGTLFLRRETCSDGMSDRPFGLSIRLHLALTDGPVAHAGCCSLTGP